MTVLAASGRVWHRNWLVYRRLWHRSLAFGFLQPVLFLTAMGIGIGALLTPEDLSAFGGFDYITWLGPGLLAAMAMQTATFESSFPISARILWRRNYEAMLATPLRTWSMITERGRSATSALISTPRFMGPGCMTRASSFMASTRRSVSP